MLDNAELVAVTRLDERGLWTVDLYAGDKHIESIGGSYPKSRYCQLDAQRKWGRSVEILVTYLRSVEEVENWLDTKYVGRLNDDGSKI